MKRSILILGVSTIVALSFIESARGADQQSDGKKPLIQMAILLDTSGSMSGLINQAKTQLWKIVNQFATTKKNGKVPRLQVALYEYGHDPLPADKGYMRKIVPLSRDLDKVSEELFDLETDGGDEYCGMVIKKATTQLKWDDSNEHLKVIFIAGNEPFTQGQVDYKKACKKAISNGIIVNTIHCGSRQKGIKGKWKDGALLADGSFSCINKDQEVTHIDAPQDKKITKLNKKLNDTYIAYGEKGEKAKKRQKEQDANAFKNASAGAPVQRTVTKANAQYRNASWDLIDAVNNDKVELEELNKKDLPEKMRDMSMKERKAYVKKKAQQREKIQKKINKLNAERKKYIAEKRREKSESGEETLGEALSETLLKQAEEKGFDKGGQEN